ncbi:putative DNA-binding protein [Geobacillus sp. TFV-3]|uniref:putative DNA-binding protein n=1 Tax=Geobacillus sp. TFV-3 TaxID=1897059 RepID=UPI00387E45D0
MRMNYLYDFYQALLTPKQRNYMALYYLDDYSLGEIAEQYEVSRQAVYDNIRRTEAMLEQYEEKLGLLRKYERRRQIIERLKDYISRHYSADAELAALVRELDELD